MMRFLLLPIALVAFVANAQTNTPENILIETPVRVTVKAKSTPIGPSASTSTLNLAINQNTHEFRLAVMQRGNVAEALAAQKARTGWKDGYLFIRDDCLNTNETKRAWRCVVDQVFTFVDSRDGKRLVHLGEVATGEDCIDELKIGCALYQGVFTDIYDALENSALISRAEAPALLLEMRVVSGEWVVDLVDTWGRNQERFSAGERCLAAKPGERAMNCIEGITPRRAYFFNSVLATYAKRGEHLDRIRAFARDALCGNDKHEARADADCSEILRLSALMLAGIRPGEKPRPRGNVQSVPLLPNK